MSKYQVELNDGQIINVPADKARTKYEYISQYGLQAVLERAHRACAYINANKSADVRIRAIICPDGDYITQF